jgi:hypothetical protein
MGKLSPIEDTYLRRIHSSLVSCLAPLSSEKTKEKLSLAKGWPCNDLLEGGMVHVVTRQSLWRGEGWTGRPAVRQGLGLRTGENGVAKGGTCKLAGHPHTKSVQVKLLNGIARRDCPVSWRVSRTQLLNPTPNSYA